MMRRALKERALRLWRVSIRTQTSTRATLMDASARNPTARRNIVSAFKWVYSASLIVVNAATAKTRKAKCSVAWTMITS